jgi:hypothetical protein
VHAAGLPALPGAAGPQLHLADQPVAAVVQLSVGGSSFSCTTATLAAAQGSFFSRLLGPGLLPQPALRLPSGDIFIDRSSEVGCSHAHEPPQPLRWQTLLPPGHWATPCAGRHQAGARQRHASCSRHYGCGCWLTCHLYSCLFSPPSFLPPPPNPRTQVFGYILEYLRVCLHGEPQVPLPDDPR